VLRPSSAVPTRRRWSGCRHLGRASRRAGAAEQECPPPASSVKRFGRMWKNFLGRPRPAPAAGDQAGWPDRV